MAENGALPSPTSKSTRPTSSFFNSPRLFTGFASKGFFEPDSTVMSPTSILDTKPFCGFKYPFTKQINPESEHISIRRHWDSKRVGLGIVDDLIDEKPDSNISKLESRTVLFGSQLKIQVPTLQNSVLNPSDSPKFPPEFGINTRNTQLGSFSHGLSPFSANKSAFGSSNSGLETPNSSGVFTECLSASETEVLEDHSNQRQTHVFEKCIVDSCCGVVGISASSRHDNGFMTVRSSYPSESFLSFCYTCKKNLGYGKDIYMYRGEKAFCSRECRYEEMLLEEEMGKLEPDDGYGFGTCS